MGSEVVACENEDIERVVSMIEEFMSHTIYDDEFCSESAATMVKTCMSEGLCFVYRVDGIAKGFIAGVSSRMMTNFNIKIGAELGWWVDKDCRSGGAGIKLLKAVERKARDMGIKYWSVNYMASSMPSSVKRIYEKNGYIENETTHTKVL